MALGRRTAAVSILVLMVVAGAVYLRLPSGQAWNANRKMHARVRRVRPPQIRFIQPLLFEKDDVQVQSTQSTTPSTRTTETRIAGAGVKVYNSGGWKHASLLTANELLYGMDRRTVAVDERNETEVDSVVAMLRRVLGHHGVQKAVLSNSAGRTEVSHRQRDQLTVVYNKVGKCGSRTMLWLIARLSRENNFAAVGSVYGNDLNPTRESQQAIRHIVTSLPSPVLYHRHVHLMTFRTSAIALLPILINMVRHPLERAVSAYYFRRFGDGQKFAARAKFPAGTANESFDVCVQRRREECVAGLWYIVPYFCGTDDLCTRPSKAALQRAKHAVGSKYFFVGLTEHFQQSARALELLLPQMFTGAADVMREQSQGLGLKARKTATQNKVPPSAETRATLMSTPVLKLEMEFYKFVQERFFNKLHELGINTTWKESE